MDDEQKRLTRRANIRRELESMGAALEKVTHGWKIVAGDSWIVLSDPADLRRSDLERLAHQLTPA